MKSRLFSFARFPPSKVLGTISQAGKHGVGVKPVPGRPLLSEKRALLYFVPPSVSSSLKRRFLGWVEPPEFLQVPLEYRPQVRHTPKDSTSEAGAPDSTLRHRKRRTEAKYGSNLGRTPQQSCLPLGGTWKGTRYRIMRWAA